jgi:hypothetical protein
MAIKRFISIALAGLMVVTSINVGGIQAFASEADLDSITITESADESNFESEDVLEDLTVEEQQPDETAEDSEIVVEEDEDAIEEASDNTLDEENETVSVKFNANGGRFENEEETLELFIKKGGVLSETIDLPIKDGFKFDGWFLDEELTREVDLAEYAFTENAVLFAKWQELATEEDGEGAQFAETVWTILDANGGVFPDGKTTANVTWETKYLNEEKFKPTHETKIFIGWFAEPECKTALSDTYNIYNLKEYPEQGTTVYAGWSDYYTVTYVFGTETGTDPIKNSGYFWDTSDYSNKKRVRKLEYKVPQGDTLNKYRPSSSYIRNTDLHYSYDNMYLDEDRTQKVYSLYSYKPTQDTTLYAGYTNNSYIVTLHSIDPKGYFVNDRYEWEENDEGKYETMTYRAYKTSTIYINVSENYVRNEDPRMAVEQLYFDKECKNPFPKDDYGYYRYKFEEDTDLYIKWAATNKVVTFDLNSSTGYFQIWNSSLSKYENSKESKKIGTDGTERYYNLNQVCNTDLHYKFLGWSKNKSATAADEGFECESEGGSSNFYATFTSDTTLYAVWDKNAYKVATFDAGEGTFKVYENGDYVWKSKQSYRTKEDGRLDDYPYDAEPNDPKKIFAGWYDGSTRVESLYSYVIAKDTTFTARYATAYTVTLNANGGYFYDYSTEQNVPKQVRRVAAGDKVYLETPKNDNDVTFGGWYADEKFTTLLGYSFTPTGDTEVYAKWLNNYKVTFDCGDGKIGSESSVSFSAVEGRTFGSNNSLPSNPVPNDSSKVFQAWYSDADCTPANRLTSNDILEYVVNGNVTFYAKYVNAYTVTFDVGTNGGSFVSKSGSEYSVKVAQGEAIRSKAPTVKSTETKVFKGWFTAAEGGEEVKNIYSKAVESDMKLYAQFIECYVLTFHANQDGALLDGGVSEVKVLVTKGTAFRYGSSEEEKDSLFQGPKVDTTNVKTGNIPFYYNGKENVGWTTKADGTGDTYVFGRYNHSCYLENGSYYNFNMYGFIPTNDMDFYVKWGEPVNVIWDPNGGTFKSESSYDETYGKLNSKGQRVITVPKGVRFTMLSKPSEYMMDTIPEGMTGCSFYYTDKDGKDYIASDYVINSTLTVYAKWYKSGSGISTERKKITFHAGEGYFGSVTSKVTEGSYTLNSKSYTSTPSIDDPTRAFLGWYKDEKLTVRYPEDQHYDVGSYYIVLKQDVTDLYAKYGPTATVTLDANGGYFDADDSRTKDPSENLREITLLKAKPEASGYGIRISNYNKRIRRDGDKIFAGWYYNPECTEDKKATIVSDGSYEYFIPEKNTTLYAKWIDYELPTSIKIKGAKDYSISIGDKFKLDAVIAPESVAKTQDVHWFLSSTTSYDSKQIKANPYYIRPIVLSTDGHVTAQAAGTVTVYAEVNGVRSETVRIYVSAGDVETSITVSSSNVELEVGDTADITASVTPASKASSVKWTSGNTKVATVDPATGSSTRITAVSAGKATIKATVDGKTAQVNVTVTEKLLPIELSPSTMSLTASEGVTGTISATLAKDFKGKTVLWSSSDTETATVTADTNDSTKAVVDPADDIDEEKEVTITATIEGTDKAAECKVTVRPVGKAKEPVADVASESVVKKNTLVNLVTETPDADIFYTTDGTTEPSTKADEKTMLYSDAIRITEDVTIKAIAVKEGLKPSKVVTFKYTVDKDWGDIGETAQKDIFEDKFENVPSGVWFLIDGKKYENAGDTEFAINYNGDKLTFSDKILVFNNTRKLIENRDYTVTYANNVNAGDVKAAKTPSFTIKGMGTFNSAAKFTFAITPEDINNAAITSEKVVTVVSGKTKLSVTKPVVTYSGKKLSAGKDYDLSYSADAATVLNDPEKTYTISIVGKGNFEGTIADAVTVKTLKKDATVVQVSKLKVDSKKLNTTYDKNNTVDVAKAFEDGTATVKDGKTALVYGKDYTVVPGEDNTSAGKHSFVVKGIEKAELAEGEKNYIGEKTGTYEIKGTAINKVKFEGFKSSVEYTGKAFELKDFGGDKLVDKSTGATLVKDTDYEVEYSNTGVVGKFNVVYTGKAGYTGTAKKVVTVKARKATGLTITVNDGNDVTFVKSGAKPEVTVKLGDTELLKGVDYSVKYKNNAKVLSKNAGKGAPTVTVKGIGNYAGTTATQTFTIVQADVSQVSVVAKDVVYKGNGKAGYALSKPQLMDDGKAVSAGKDINKLSKDPYEYTYLAQTKLDDGTLRAAGDTVKKEDKIPAGTTIEVRVKVTCPANSTYKSAEGGTWLTGYYRIASSDISKAKITDKNGKTLTMTVNNGEPVKITKSDIKVTVGSGKKAVVLKDSDYDIVSITNNTGVGNATITIRGKGNYGGTKSQSVKITAKGMK